MPSAHNVMQLRLWALPLMVTLHSMQTPMPQRGAQGRPSGERRNRLTPARAMAAATTVPAATLTVCPFTRSWTRLFMVSV